MHLKSIHEIFKDRILRIPSYQRGYSWTINQLPKLSRPEDFNKVKGQLMDLWNDIINIPEGKWHYTGLLTMVEAPNNGYQWLPNYKQYAIVDGQQRITSILILIAVMVEKAKALGFELGVRDGDTLFQYLYVEKSGIKAYIFGYDRDNPSDKFFRKHILSLDEIEDDSRESVYTENLKRAKAFFECVVEHRIGNSSDQKQGLQNLFDRVTANLRMNEYILPDELDEYVVFETMNNRGKPLSELEKLKNRLMYLGDKFETTTTGSESSEVFSNAQKQDLEEAINKGWITIYQALGAKKEAPLDDEDFIRNHWIAYFDRYNRSEAAAYAGHLFNEYFTLEQVYMSKLTAQDIRNYVRSLQECAVIWNKIHHTEFFDSNDIVRRAALLGLHRVGFRASFKPLVLAAMREKNGEAFLPVVSLLEDYAFKIFHVSDRQSNTGDSRLYRLAASVYHGKISAKEACDEIRAHMTWYYKFTLFKNQIDELFDSGEGLGFYRWSGLHYFLFRYDNFLREKNSTTTCASKLNWEDFFNKNTIEHIYPQSAAKSWEEFNEGQNTPKRRQDFDALQSNWVAFSEYSAAHRKRLCNSLGNLLAISNSDNASFSNDPFHYKVDQTIKGDGYRNRGYRHDSISAQLVAKETNWTPESIKIRGIKMLNKIMDFLGEASDSVSEVDKLSFLGLEFMAQKSEGPQL
jgi:uncharacterized protein with ParB-like and HNH nuclease domain